ncbi:MAG: hypothetical protein WCW02_00710 [Candidatus Buchananbacteria bacterium]
MNKLKILNAVYCDPNNHNHGYNATAILNKILNGNKLYVAGYPGSYNALFKSYDSAFNDPALGTPKILEIKLNFGWKVYEKTYKEDQIINLFDDLVVGSKRFEWNRFIRNQWVVAIGSGIVVVIFGYFFSDSSLFQFKNSNIGQMSIGSGDNVAGDKITYLSTSTSSVNVDKEYSNISPQEIINIINKQPNSALKQEFFDKYYKGKRVSWLGTVADVKNSMTLRASSTELLIYFYQPFSVTFNSLDIQGPKFNDLKTLDQSNKVQLVIRGKIDRISDIGGRFDHFFIIAEDYDFVK